MAEDSEKNVLLEGEGFQRPPEDQLGISFAEKTAGKVDAIGAELGVAERYNLRETQLRLRSSLDLAAVQLLLRQFREDHPDLKLSLHLSAPQVGESGELINRSRLSEELALAENGELVTVHPLQLSSESKSQVRGFQEIGAEQKTHLLNMAASRLTDLLVIAREQNKKVILGIENVGQTAEEMKELIGRVCQEAIDNGFSQEDVVSQVGVTFDINHALMLLPDNANYETARQTVEHWLQLLGPDIKGFHFGVSKAAGADPAGYSSRVKEALKLCQSYGITAPFYLESKEDLATTEAVLTSSRQAITVS